MSRSRRKHPFTGWTKTESEKQDKRLANRVDRRINKEILYKTNDDSQTIPKKVTSNIFDMGKDGKIRFDPKKWPESMRK